jgi:hypothetical protein
LASIPTTFFGRSELFFLSVLFADLPLFGRPGGLSPLAFFTRPKKACKKELKQWLNPWRGTEC